MRFKKIAAGAAALVLSTAILAGCGDKEDTSSNSTDGGGDISLPDGSALTKDDFLAMAEAAQEAGSSHMKMTMSGSGITMTAEGDQQIGETALDSAIAMTMETSGISMDMIMVDKKMYISMGAYTQDKYVMLDLTDESDPMVQQYGSLLDQSDVSAQLEQLADIIKSVEDTGETETIDGVETKAYEITVDGKKAAGLSDTDASQMPDEVTYIYYVGSDNLVRRMTMDLLGQSMQMDFTDWGKPVSVKAPSGDQISDMDLSSMMSGAS